MKGYINEPHTAIFTGQTKCGKTHLVLDLIEKEYSKHFDYIIIIFQRFDIVRPTILRNRSNKTITFEKVSGLYYWIGNLSKILACSEV